MRGRIQRSLSGLVLGLSLSSPVWALPAFQEVRSSYRSSETQVLSREGVLLQRLRTDLTVRRGAWVALGDVSPALRLALLVSEDQRFYAHSGVDWQAASAAAWGNLWNTRTRGASTITMQLVGLLDSTWRSSNSGRSVGQKLGQAWSATQLEKQWRKDQILEAYLNLLPFRGELVGMDALSRTLFGKAPHALDARESAIAAALVRGPNAAPAVVAQRACGVWQAMQQMQGRSAESACVGMLWQTEQVLRARLWPATEGVAPHWARRVWTQHLAGRVAPQAPAVLAATVETTLSAPIQQLAVQSLQRHLRELQGRNVEDGAVVVLDNASGEVLAWVGSSGDLSQASEVDGVLAWRQPGSTLKPFLYAQALDEQRLTAASLLEDSPAQIATPSGLYIPQNYDRRFKGWVSVRTALASSLNVPAVRTLVMLTPDAFGAQLQRLGIALRESPGYYGYSLALGSAEMPLLHLTNAYRALANRGQFTPVAAAVRAPAPAAGVPPQAVISPQAAFIIAHILSDAQARAMTFGMDSVLNTRFWSAVKTGTSKDMRDNWAIGWSQHYTVGVWVGNASGAAMHSVSGSSGAAPIWADVMAGLHAQGHRPLPSHPPAAPTGVVLQPVVFAAQGGGAALDAPRQEWFIAGTQQAEFVPPAAAGPGRAAAGAALRIVRPVDGTILALDPDIPPARQQLLLQATRSGGRWWMDGQRLGSGAQLHWAPLPGRHVLQLQDAQGRVLDEVRLEVRGAAMRTPAAGHSRSQSRQHPP